MDTQNNFSKIETPVPSQEQEEDVEYQENFSNFWVIVILLIIIGLWIFTFFSGKWYGENQLYRESNVKILSPVK